LIFFGTGAGGIACTCVLDDASDWPFPKEDGRSILFRGTVQSRKPLPPVTGHKRYAAAFRVHEYWRSKVSVSVTIVVKMTMGGGDCLQGGPGYLVGEDYLVYAYQEKGGELYFDNAACVPVGESRNLSKVIEALGSGRKPAV
jgi:hypothetical protein